MSTLKGDAVIIGGGIIGAACAYFLTRRGLRPVVVEKHYLAAGASGACSGYCSVSSKKPGLMMELAKLGKALYQELVQAEGWDIHLSPPGGLILLETEEERAFIGGVVEAIRATGVPIALLDRRELHELEPEVSDHVLGAAHSPTEFTVNPYMATQALLETAVARGATLLTGEGATDFLRAGDALRGVRTERREIHAPAAVIAAGVWSAALGELAGIKLPVIPRRGEILVSEKTRPPTRLPLMGAKYLVAKAHPERAENADDPLVRMGHGFVMETLPTGQVLIGSTRMFVGFDRGTTALGQRTLAAQAVRMVPALRDVQVLRGYAGLRPYVPDKLPIVGAVGSLPGLLVATGHEGDGITLAPVTGRLIAELLCNGRPFVDIAALSPERFGTQPA